MVEYSAEPDVETQEDETKTVDNNKQHNIMIVCISCRSTIFIIPNRTCIPLGTFIHFIFNKIMLNWSCCTHNA